MNDKSIFSKYPNIKIPIGEAARMFNVCIKTIRIYEKEGLLSAGRSEGNHRQFGKKEFDILKAITFLTQKLKINLAGVKIIFAIFKILKIEQNKYLELIKQAEIQTNINLE